MDERRVSDRVFTIAMLAMGLMMVGLLALLMYAMTRPLPTCPDGYVLAGGGHGGRYHCIPGAEPRW